MTNHDFLRRLRYALDLDDASLAALFRLGGVEMPVDRIPVVLGKGAAEDEVVCTDVELRAMLDGLILDRRGPPPEGATREPDPDFLTNNEILKKLRIALVLHEKDLREILDSVKQPMSKAELSALFRKPGHKHYRDCGDQVFRKFMRGLTTRLRPESAEDQPPA